MVRQKIIRTGNSLAVTIPSLFVQGVGVKPGQTVKVKPDLARGRVIYFFSGTKQLAFPLSR
jgi:antitoxin component of MazEF toxin-antitoxin module